MVFIAARMLWANDSAPEKETQISPSDEFPRACVVKLAGLGLGVGLLTGSLGVGGGFVIVPSLVFVVGYPMRIAIGTSLLVIGLTAIGGIVGHVHFGEVGRASLDTSPGTA